MNGASRQTAAQLKAAFDASFAQAATLDGDAAEGLLAIRAGSNQVAIRAREIAGIMRCPPLTALPSDHAVLSGLVAVRGQLVGTYSVSALLGEGHNPSGRGWIVLCAADRSVALLFDELVGFEQVGSDEIHTIEAPLEGIPTKEVVQLRGFKRAVVSVSTLLETIRGTTPTGADKE